MAAEYLKTYPPHLSARESVPGLIWKSVLAFSPVVITSIVFFGTQSLLVITASVAASVLAELLGRKIAGRSVTLYDGSAVFCGLLTAMLLPAGIPLWMAFLGSFAGVFLAREMFGGVGQNPLHPVLVGYVFLQASFPVAMAQAYHPFTAESGMMPLAIIKHTGTGSLPIFWHYWVGLYPGNLGSACALAVMAGGAILIRLRLTHWEVPFLYLMTLFFFNTIVGYHPWVNILSGNTLLMAFFILTDPVTSPHTRVGERVFAILAALITFTIRFFSVYPDGSAFALLTAGVLSPWVDDWIRWIDRKRQNVEAGQS